MSFALVPLSPRSDSLKYFENVCLLHFVTCMAIPTFNLKEEVIVSCDILRAILWLALVVHLARRFLKKSYSGQTLQRKSQGRRYFDFACLRLKMLFDGWFQSIRLFMRRTHRERYCNYHNCSCGPQAIGRFCATPGNSKVAEILRRHMFPFTPRRQTSEAEIVLLESGPSAPPRATMERIETTNYNTRRHTIRDKKLG